MEDVTFSIDETAENSITFSIGEAPIVFSVESLAVVTPDDFDLAHASMTGKDANDHPQYLLVSDWGAHPAYGIIAQDLVDYAAAYGWGDHAGLYSVLAHDHAGVYSVVAHMHDYSGVYSVVAHTHDQLHAESHSIESHGTNATAANLDVLVGGAETSLHAHAAGAHDHDEDYLGIADSRIAKWDTAYGWGDHDGLYSVVAHVHDSTYIGLTDERIVQWEAAYGWGDHAGLYSVLAHDHDSDYVGLAGNQSIAGNKTFTGNCIYSEPLTVPAPVQDWHAARVDWVNSSIASDIAAIDLSDLHSESHTIASHGTNATEGNLDTLVGTGYADLLHKHLNTNYDYSLTVAQNGTGDFTSIQDAIDSITVVGDSSWVIILYPGTYTENVTLKAGVSLVGIGSVGDVTIQEEEGTVLTIPYTPFSVSVVRNLTLKCAVSGISTAKLVASGGFYTRFDDVVFDVDIANGSMTDIELTSGTTTFESCLFQHDSTGTSAGDTVIIKNKGTALFNVSGGTGSVVVESIANTTHVFFIEDESSTDVDCDVFNFKCSMLAETAGFAGLMEFWRLEYATVENRIQRSYIHLSTPSGATSSVGAYVDVSTAGVCVYSSNNDVSVTGFDENYTAAIAASAVCNSHFDNINAVDGVTGAGVYNFVNSPSPGNIQCSGGYLNMYDAVKTVGPRGCDYTEIQVALDDNPEPNILFTIQPDTYVNDTLNFTANNQTIQGVSESNKDAEITNTTTICDYGAFTNCKVSRVYVKQTQASNDPVVTGTGTGSCNFDDVINELICGAGTGTGTPLIPRNYTGTGDITILRGEVIQSNASSTTNIDYSSFAAPIEPSAGGSITVDGSKVTLNQTGKHYICFGVGTLSSGSFEVNRTEIIVNTTSCQFAVGLCGSYATGVKFAAFNKISVIGTCFSAFGVSGTTTSTLTINSSYSSYIIESGTSSNIGVSAGSLVIINTSFDVYLTTTFSDGVGTINSISSDSPGNLSLSNVLTTKEFWLSDTVYDDWSSALSSNQPTNPSAKINPNDAEASVTFDNDTNLTDYLYFSPQMPHKWKLGTVIYPHLHWWQTTTNQPNWLLQYRWQKNDGLKTTTWTYLPLDAEIFTWSTGTLNQISYNATGITPPSGYSISDIIQFRLLRDVADTSGEWGSTAETSPVSADAVSFDYHYEIDSLGSRDEYTK